MSMFARRRPRRRLTGAVVMVARTIVTLAVAAPAVAAPTMPTAAAASSVRSASGTTATWAWPVAAPWRVLRGFEAPETRYSAGHRGVDLAARPGDPVFAPTGGTVSFAGSVAGRPVVTLRVGDALLVSVEPVGTALATGDEIGRGAMLGTVGAGGHCDGRCVHLGVRVDGKYVSPLMYYGGVARAVLLPLG